MDSENPLVYQGLQFVIKRNVKKSKFKTILETMREIVRKKETLPSFIEDVLIRGVSGINNESKNESDLKNFIQPLIEKRVSKGISLTNEQIDCISDVVCQKNIIRLISGPPLTGKTDVGLNIASILANSKSNEKILIMVQTKKMLHSIFSRLEDYGIHERYALMLGIKNENLSAKGRVDYLLRKRLIHLNNMKLITKCLKEKHFEDFTCESAIYVYNSQLISKWEDFLTQVKVEASLKEDKSTVVSQLFPFKDYFENLVFEKDYTKDLETAKGKWREVEEMMQEIKESRGFEIIRNEKERTNYIISTQAKVIGMLTSYAAVKREKLHGISLNYTTLIIDSAQMTPCWETVIPLTLSPKISRVILISNPKETTIFSKNEGFLNLSMMDSSLFELCSNYKVKSYNLTKHCGVKPSIQSIYDLQVSELQGIANAGFAYEYQWINVDEDEMTNKVEGQILETNPNVNLPEAEYIVSTFLFMCVIGYKPSDITILTATKGQKVLVKEIIDAKCLKSGLLKEGPSAITTFDKYQGMHNSYVLVSMVKRKNLGNLEDVRKFEMALTRAREGLYIFGKMSLFTDYYSDLPIIKSFVSRPLNLLVIPNEKYPSTRKFDTMFEAKVISNYKQMYELVNEILENKLK